jgi:glucosyl-3-phosphoglycerate synthase
VRTHHHSDFAAAGTAPGVSVVIPAREEAATIASIVATCAPLVGQVLVVDAASGDGTAEIAARAGAEVVQEADLLPQFGPVLGKGDAMWRALSVVRGDVVVYLDADTERFGEHFVRGLVGPLLAAPEVQFVKAFYRRPFKLGDTTEPEGGGRVTELTAKPLLAAFYPELAALHQPLSGEVAACRSLLERLPFSTGYAVEIAMLIGAWSAVGIDALAQVDLDERQNRHQPLGALRPMADAVLGAVAARLVREGRLAGVEPDVTERPPMRSARELDRGSRAI